MQSSGRVCSRDRAALAAILAFSLLTKLGLALLVWFRNRAAIWHPDSASYHYLALNMFRHGLFSRSTGPPYVYEAFRTPGYPLVLAAALNLDFLCIHPFRDGNGRVSRLLFLLACYH